MSHELPFRSLRLSPDWNRHSGRGIVGLIQMVFDIYKINPNASNWLEIGTAFGESSLIFSSFDFVKNVTCIDPANNPNVLKIRHTRLKQVEHKIKQHIVTSKNFCQNVKDGSIDVVYIDGDHSYESVLQDCELWYPKIKSGGFLCGHDYSSHTKWKDVKRAVDVFLKENNLSIHKQYCDTSFMIRV